MTDCQRCGDCCRFVVVVTGKITNDDLLAYFKAHGIQVRAKSVLIPSVCQHLQWWNDRGSQSTECDIYDTRPELCRRGRCLHE